MRLSHLPRPPRHLYTTKSCSQRGYSLFAFVIVALTVFTQIPESSSAAALTQRLDSESKSFEFAEDTLNLLHELARFLQREHNIDIGLAGQTRRLRKRHNAIEKAEVVSGDDEPEWQNVCGRQSGWSGDEVPENLSYDYINLYLKNLRKSVRLEYKALKTNRFHEIDIDHMKTWRRHERKYKFLPTLEQHSAIALVCWHEDMQTFIASFAYLYKIQQNWDKKHSHTQSGITRELHEMLQSSRRVLCELETAIRGSHPRDKLLKLNTLTRDEMFATISFYTNNAGIGQRSVNRIDLRFVKFFYQNYLLRIWKLIPRHPNNIQLEYSCDKSSYRTILDTSSDTDGSIMDSTMDDYADK